MNHEFPRCILFDLDGTLVDSLPGIEYSVRKSFAACNLAAPVANLRHLIGPPIRTILSSAGNITDERALDCLEREFRASYDREGWLKSACFPYVHQVLRNLNEHGHRLFVVSNKPRHISLRVLEKEEVLNLFEAVLTRDSRSPGFAGKDEMIEALLRERSIRPDQCLIVGDTSDDAQAAAALGIPFVWMTHGYGTLSQGTSSPVAYVLDGFSQFLTLMTKEPVLD